MNKFINFKQFSMTKRNFISYSFVRGINEKTFSMHDCQK